MSVLPNACRLRRAARNSVPYRLTGLSIFCLWYNLAMETLLSRITIDPTVCHGKPCVRGLRYPVETLLELLSSGMTFEDVLADYPDLEREDLLAVLAFAARLSRTRRLQPALP